LRANRSPQSATVLSKTARSWNRYRSLVPFKSSARRRSTTARYSQALSCRTRCAKSAHGRLQVAAAFP
jgi:hypothetical protein